MFRDAHALAGQISFSTDAQFSAWGWPRLTVPSPQLATSVILRTQLTGRDHENLTRNRNFLFNCTSFAARTWIKPKNIVPIHYGANPITKGTLAGFQAAMQGSPIKVIPMTEGQTIEF